MRARRRGSLLGLAVLAYLAQGPMHPYELGRSLQRNGDERSIKFSHGSLYTAIEQLTRAGFVEPRGTTRQGKRPERTVYALTASGRHELANWLLDLVAKPTHEFSDFVAALSLISALPPADVAEAIRRRLDGLCHLRDEAQAVVTAANSNKIPPLFVIEEHYRIHMLTAEIKFAEDLLQQMSAPSNEWIDDWARYHSEQTTLTKGQQ